MNSITFKSGSKSFGLSAMKSAWMFSYNPDLIARVRAYHRQDFSTLAWWQAWRPIPKVEIGWINWCRISTPTATSRIVHSRQHSAGQVGEAQGTYLAWLDVSAAEDKIGAKESPPRPNKSNTSRHPVTPEMVMERWFVQNAKVQINAGSNYGLGGPAICG